MGWKGSGLYISQAIGDDEATGICNWQGDAIYYFGKDDGDDIQTCIIQSDRLLVFKRRSTWALEGDEPDSFRVRQLIEGTGAAGARAACSSGARAWVHSGEGGIFQLSNDDAKPIGWMEVGHHKDRLDLTRADQIVCRNWLGDLLLFHYTPTGHTENDEALVLDLRNGTWTHFSGWVVNDALVQKDALDFNRATYLMADPTDYAAGTDDPSVNPWLAAWLDARVGMLTQTYMQRVDNATGAAKWTANGVQVGANLTSVSDPPVVLGLSDGGCIVAFIESPASVNDVYVQRYDINGVAVWASPLCVCNSANAQSNLGICTNGSDGCFVCWQDSRAGGGLERIYLQHVTGAGVATWAANGVQTSILNVRDLAPSIVYDGSGGCLVAWRNNTGGSAFHRRVQRYDAYGSSMWTTGGVDVGVDTYLYNQTGALRLVGDGSGGALVVFMDTTTSIKVQSVTSAGAVAWTSASVFGSGTIQTYSLAICPDSAGGCWLAWVDSATGAYHVRCRRIDSTGTALPAGGAVLVSAVTGYVSTVAVSPDDLGGCYVGWQQYYAVSDYRLCLAHVTSAGVSDWPSSPRTPGSYTSSYNMFGIKLSTDGSTGCIMGWTTADVCAQRFDIAGNSIWPGSYVTICGATGYQTLGSISFPGAISGGAVPAPPGGYKVWSGFQGTKDRAAADGSGGEPITWVLTNAARDDGYPDDWKDYTRIEGYFDRASDAVVVTLSFDDDSPPIAVTLNPGRPSMVWGQAGIVWGQAGVRWGSDTAKHTRFSGITGAALGRKYTARWSAKATKPLVMTGQTVDGIVLPERGYS